MTETPLGATRASSILYVGLMSGTSLDGVDGVLASFNHGSGPLKISTRATAYLPFPDALRAELLALQTPGFNEIEREAVASNALAACYAECIKALLNQSGTPAEEVRAVGVHGQTIRHRPEMGFTRQTNNPSLLAEMTGIDVIADFRHRDIAAGGQGAPLVPAFHHAVFDDAGEARVIVNVGGIANISVLPGNISSSTGGIDVIGYDTGPGNVLMDHWVKIHRGKPYDDAGKWAASGRTLPALLEKLLDEPFFRLAPPKSTGRDLFHLQWLEERLSGFQDASAADIQATLAALTAVTIADAIRLHAPQAGAVYVCGGGAHNHYLLDLIRHHLRQKAHPATVDSTDILGIAPSHVEPLAFAWLASRFIQLEPGNLPGVTGAKGLRILGALYPSGQ
jgi:anhydro-N-acetylmuramic acid kinase